MSSGSNGFALGLPGQDGAQAAGPQGPMHLAQGGDPARHELDDEGGEREVNRRIPHRDAVCPARPSGAAGQPRHLRGAGPPLVRAAAWSRDGSIAVTVARGHRSRAASAKVPVPVPTSRMRIGSSRGDQRRQAVEQPNRARSR